MHGQTLIVSASTQETEQRALPQAASDPAQQQEPQHWHPSCQHHLPAFGYHTMGRTDTQGTRKVEPRPRRAHGTHDEDSSDHGYKTIVTHPSMCLEQMYLIHSENSVAL